MVAFARSIPNKISQPCCSPHIFATVLTLQEITSRGIGRSEEANSKTKTDFRNNRFTSFRTFLALLVQLQILSTGVDLQQWFTGSILLQTFLKTFAEDVCFALRNLRFPVRNEDGESIGGTDATQEL
eukprot:6479125-Amphidinium_carterae.5